MRCGSRRPRVGPLVAWLLFAWSCAGASGVAWSQGVEPVAVETDDDAGEPVYVTSSDVDRAGRVMAPVFVNGRGPYAFVVDTGASRSVVAPHVVASLGLTADADRPVNLRGVTGSATVPSIVVDSLRVGDLELTNQRMPVIDTNIFAGADGILGIDGLQGMCLRASFVKAEISITRKGCPREVRDWLRARATLRFGGLVMVRARVGGRHVDAVIDTGAERSLGNHALLELLRLQSEAGDPRGATQVLGATEHRVAGSIVEVPAITLGEFDIGGLAVTFGDFDVFRLWDLQDKPAIVLGMDVIGRSAGIAIDYRKSEIRVQTRDGDFRSIDRSAIPGRLPSY
jgi:predicted aspartyl protease